MRLTQPLLQLPIRFDAEALAAEVRALPDSAWDPHPTGFVGNEAVRLVTPHGALTDAIEGPMAPTEHLRAAPTLMEVMAAARRRLGPQPADGAGAGGRGARPCRRPLLLADSSAHPRSRSITNPGVLFTCGDAAVHMAPGECWVFDSFRWHDVQNRGSERRIHLVLDTVGGDRISDLVEAAQAGAAAPPGRRPAVRGRRTASSSSGSTPPR